MSWAAEATTELKALHGGKDRACQGLKSGPGQAQQGPDAMFPWVFHREWWCGRENLV